MSADLNLAHLRAVAEAATPGEWRYRPDPDDDWGFVRAHDRGIIATARAGRYVRNAEMWEHRRDKTDPYGPNALHIATFDPPTALRIIGELEEAKRERDSWKAVAEMNATSGGFTARQLETMTARAEAAESLAEQARKEGMLAAAEFAKEWLKGWYHDLDEDAVRDCGEQLFDSIRSRATQGGKTDA